MRHVPIIFFVHLHNMCSILLHVTHTLYNQYCNIHIVLANIPYIHNQHASILGLLTKALFFHFHLHNYPHSTDNPHIYHIHHNISTNFQAYLDYLQDTHNEGISTLHIPHHSILDMVHHSLLQHLCHYLFEHSFCH